MFKSFNTFSYWLSTFCICLLLVSGCKKTETVPDPDMAKSVAGTYTFTTISLASSSQPTTVASGNVAMVRNGTALDKVDLTLSYTTASSSGSSTFSESKTITLQRADNTIDLYDGSTKVGSWVLGTLNLANYPFSTTSVTLTATKQ
ncbi:MULTISPECIES: hypothetical protein [unclassified Spirosoma]|uniref:hypothetical protein n=1 Tax=unclassified Spirosoma TaxID=2621999 RepID=UPI00095BFFF0|nr:MULTISPECIES: hypothetical protein [unclassified Spirosoma]MBN8825914.1 hypothetical protein [Spirosoma sp.]OJW70599.1 MAG: hypothetical protein BGO59_25585 [Spirosoma sp. 48-14]